MELKDGERWDVLSYGGCLDLRTGVGDEYLLQSLSEDRYRSFWREIARMSFVPFVLILVSLWLIDVLMINLVNPIMFISSAFLFALFYIPLFWSISMNGNERELFLSPFRLLGRRSDL